MVELRRADRPRTAEVVLGAVDGPLADGDAALVDVQHRSAGSAQDQRSRRSASRASGTDAGPLPYGQASRPTFVAVVRTLSPLSESAYSTRSESVNGYPGCGRRTCSMTTRCGSRSPTVQGASAHEAVDRVPPLRLGERELVATPVELVGAVLAAGSATGSAPARGPRRSARRPRSRRAAPALRRSTSAGRRRPRRPWRAGRRTRSRSARRNAAPASVLIRRPVAYVIRSSRWSPTRSEFAIAVSAGFTAPIDGKKLVSTT